MNAAGLVTQEPIYHGAFPLWIVVVIMSMGILAILVMLKVIKSGWAITVWFIATIILAYLAGLAQGTWHL